VSLPVPPNFDASPVPFQPATASVTGVRDGARDKMTRDSLVLLRLSKTRQRVLSLHERGDETSLLPPNLVVSESAAGRDEHEAEWGI
jgi:hypothetical protein